MHTDQLAYLIEMRKDMFSGHSIKQEEIINKLDELILAELTKPETIQEPA